MKIFIHTGKGHYIGSAVIVLAEHKVQAGQMIRAELDRNGLSTESVNIETIYELDKKVIVYSDNGDY